MLDFNLIFKIGAVGVVLIIIDKVLKSGGKEEYAVIANFAGIIIILMMIISLISKLFTSIQTLFYF
ncbi:MAG: stage III sporulation protein AC [Clostridium argentinense]|jgi:stage III sporulation protein AC|uniref:Stage III sporulation protein AC n=2 Tax=Clostridium TaxID=1485 RepID=A0A0C1R9J2_9CLOT|nr:MULTISPECIES: stage III sporulation protein AC [Clostridium]ARC85238.1 stage III sporulation protein AC [Clostridium argentinense]KIE47111.1 stage III sporulation protein AC [Clostridium argentinense CDC 2741]MBD8048384.1 stage III sporulation protein AC [Clostridium faecium]MBS5823223.1 stage III sporulation protein AC [Clostridium argentinense]MDU1349017.1 stage III sporulation protein AC [Clostridium argentinense]